jgi:multidrug resistance efflux pump
MASGGKVIVDIDMEAALQRLRILVTSIKAAEDRVASLEERLQKVNQKLAQAETSKRR